MTFYIVQLCILLYVVFTKSNPPFHNALWNHKSGLYDMCNISDLLKPYDSL